MKILHVISSLNPEDGGPVESVKQYCENYKLDNFVGEVICSDNPNSKWLKKNNLPKIYALGPVNYKYSYNTSLYKWLDKNVRSYDAIIVNGIWQFHSIAVRNACVKHKIPYFLFTHGMLDPYFNQDKLKFIKKFFYWIFFERKVLRDAKKVIFTTDVEKKLAQKSFWPYKCNGVTIGYGIKGANKENLKSSIFLKKFNLKKNKYLLYFGRFHEKKGIDLLIKAFNKIVDKKNNITLVLAGPKNKYFKTNIEKLIINKKLKKNIIFTGPLYGALKWQAISNCYFLCLTSHSENFGIVVAESLSCGKPVLISNKVNLYGTIKKYKSGYVCDNNQHSIELALKKILNFENKKYLLYQKNANKCFKENFQITKPVLNLIKLIKKNK